MSHCSRIAFLLGLIFPLLIPAGARALTPVVQYQDLVAGEGAPGFEDGDFYSARFNYPMGLALNTDGSILYVADFLNNRIRAVLLDKKNEVETIAGTGEMGKKDGPVSLATFYQPASLAWLTGDGIAVSDQGNRLIRMIDLKTMNVSTIAGGGLTGKQDGDALQTQMYPARDLVYDPVGNYLYFTQPEAGALRRLNLNTHWIETVLKDNVQVPNPASLCLADGKLYLADKTLPSIYQLKIKEGKKEAAPEAKKTTSTVAAPAVIPAFEIGLERVGQGQSIIALTGMDQSLYCYQADPQAPIIRIFPNPMGVTFVSVWGDILMNPSAAQLLPQFEGVGAGAQVGFIPDPRSKRRFYVSNPAMSIVSSFRDLSMYTVHSCYNNSLRMTEFEYPYEKPKGTTRIMLAGRSVIYWGVNDHQFEQKNPAAEDGNIMITLAKKVELTLNTQAALNDVPGHFEVFNAGMIQSHQLYVWPYYTLAPIAQKYGLDYLVIMMDSGTSLASYFQSPVTPEGVPAEFTDPEFVAKPDSEKFKTGPLHELFEVCKKKKMIDNELKPDWVIPPLGTMAADPDVREKLVDVLSPAFQAIEGKLRSTAAGEGKSCRLAVCFFPLSIDTLDTKPLRTLWKEICVKNDMPFLDLTDDFTVLRPTYSPYNEIGDVHFTANGLGLFSTIFVHELIKSKLIPFEAMKP